MAFCRSLFFIIQKEIIINSNIQKRKEKLLFHIPKKIFLLEPYVTFFGKLDGIGGKLCNTQ